MTTVEDNCLAGGFLPMMMTPSPSTGGNPKGQQRQGEGRGDRDHYHHYHHHKVPSVSDMECAVESVAKKFFCWCGLLARDGNGKSKLPRERVHYVEKGATPPLPLARLGRDHGGEHLPLPSSESTELA